MKKVSTKQAKRQALRDIREDARRNGKTVFLNREKPLLDYLQQTRGGVQFI